MVTKKRETYQKKFKNSVKKLIQLLERIQEKVGNDPNLSNAIEVAKEYLNEK